MKREDPRIRGPGKKVGGHLVHSETPRKELPLGSHYPGEEGPWLHLQVVCRVDTHLVHLGQRVGRARAHLVHSRPGSHLGKGGSPGLAEEGTLEGRREGHLGNLQGDRLEDNLELSMEGSQGTGVLLEGLLEGSCRGQREVHEGSVKEDCGEMEYLRGEYVGREPQAGERVLAMG